MDVEAWLKDLGLKQHAVSFAENGVDACLLPELTNEDLKDLGVARLADRKKILSAITMLATATEPLTEKSARLPEAPRDRAERRQLTVVFVDLVDSTGLSQRLDPEDLRDVMRRYQDAVAGAVTRFDGHVARFLGDGVLAYFGWPHAHEDQAERAVRVGLACIEAVREVKLVGGAALRSRVGIATGRVVIGDIIGEVALDSDAVVGETPNLAARLQAVAQPDEVVIGPTTRRLIGDAFELSDLGRQDLKGIQDPVPAWRVVAERLVESRFETAHPGVLTRFVGREHELGLLLERWERAKAGEGQSVLLSGEAGIGKSRIVQVLRESIGPDSHVCLHYQCSPLHANSAFYPVIRHLEQAAGFQANDVHETKFDKLEKLLADLGEDVRSVAPLFAALLALPGAERYGPINVPPQQLKVRTLDALAAHLLAAAGRRPALLVFEDAHWIDPSSRELLEDILARVIAAPVLVLITHRPEFSAEWSGHAHVTALTLGRLSRSQGVEMVCAAGGSELTEGAVARIAERTDGVPLFLEELTHSMTESGTLAEDADVPASLQASLTERLDRLDEAREIAYVGAVIGRDFAYPVLASVVETSEDELEGLLSRLLASGLVFSRGRPPKAVYTFKHSLVQDAAYTGLLKRRRQQLHARIATVLEERFPDTAQAEPEVLAHHFEQGQDLAKALDYWIEAGDRAGRVPAPQEAIAHYWRALDLVERVPDTPEIRRRHLATVVSLMQISINIGTNIWRNDDERTGGLSLIECALETAAEIGDVAALALIEAFKAGQLNDEVLYARAVARAERFGDRALQAEIAHRYSGFLGRNGRFEDSLSHIRTAIELFGKIGNEVQQGLAMAGAGRCYSARAGNLAESLRYASQARTLAETTSDPQIESCMAMEAEPYMYKGLWKCTVQVADEGLPAAWQIGNWSVVLWASSWATIAHVKLACLDDARRLIEGALSGADGPVGFDFPRIYARIAHGQLSLACGDLEEARAAVSWALDTAERDDCHLEHGAACRLFGQVHEAAGDRREADRHYRRSLDVLGRIQSRPELAQSLLAYGRFNLGQDRDEGARLLKRALKLFQDMDATGWIDETRSALLS